MRPTRYYSKKQESAIAKAVAGKRVANSGATLFAKGDIALDDWLIEAKTKIQDSDSMSVKRDWIHKNRDEAFAMGKNHSAVAISFGDGESHYIISEYDFLRLLQYESEDE